MSRHFIVHFEPMDVLAESLAHAESIASKQLPKVLRVVLANLTFDAKKISLIKTDQISELRMQDFSQTNTVSKRVW